MKEHIKELNKTIVQYTELTRELFDELKKYVDKYGELESQKEGKGCEYAMQCKDCKCDYCSKAYKEEPNQIEEVFWKGYAKGVDVQVDKDYLSKEQLEEIKQALQQ